MTKVIETEKFTVRIHGEVDKVNLLMACKKYCEKVDLKKGKSTNENFRDRNDRNWNSNNIRSC